MQWVRNWSIITLCSVCLLLCAGCGSDTTHRAGSSSSQADPSSSTYQPTPPRPQEVGERLAGPIVYTVDARSKDVWMYFDFSRGSVVAVQDPRTEAWDLAFRRHVIRTNGGATNPSGQGALLSLDERDLAAVSRVPDGAVFVSDVRTKKRLTSTNPAVEKWYNYSYLANVLVPKSVVYIVRTQDGKYAKMRLLSYYCKDGISGCMTFEYVYQGDGSTTLAVPSTRVSRHVAMP